MNRRSTYRDPAGELGTTEDDQAFDVVRPDYIPEDDPHGYFTLDRVLGYVISSAVGATVALVTIWLLRGMP